MCPLISDELISIILSSKSASFISPNVDLNEAIKSVGRFLKKPTVSLSKILLLSSREMFLVVVSNVANSSSLM